MLLFNGELPIIVRKNKIVYVNKNPKIANFNYEFLGVPVQEVIFGFNSDEEIRNLE